MSNALGGATSFPATLTVGASMSPALSVARAGTNVVIAWPTDFATAVLEHTSILPAPPQDWTPVTGTFQTNEISIWIALPIVDRAFFRLRQP